MWHQDNNPAPFPPSQDVTFFLSPLFRAGHDSVADVQTVTWMFHHDQSGPLPAQSGSYLPPEPSYPGRQRLDPPSRVPEANMQRRGESPRLSLGTVIDDSNSLQVWPCSGLRRVRPILSGMFW